MLESSFLTAVGLALGANFIKNIFEELVWRGYLYSTLDKQNIKGLQNHLVVGLIWAAWHLPYLDAFTRIYHDMAWYIYVPLFFVGTILTAILYGEIRRRSGTVWTAVLLHTTANAFVNTLFFEEYIFLAKDYAWLLAPSIDNLGYIFLIGTLAILIYKSKFKTIA